MLSRFRSRFKYTFSIADKLCDCYWPMAILIGIAFFGIMCYIAPTKWLGWLISTPFVAWGGPIALLLIIGGLKGVLYCFVHPKRVVTKYLFKGLGIFLYISAILVSAYLVAYGVGDSFTKEDSSGWETAYISGSHRATKYHYSGECRYLKNSWDIIDYSVAEAEAYKYLPCKLCLKTERDERVSDKASLFFVGFSIIFFYMGNWFYKVSRKYKIQSPIVKKIQP